MIPSKIAKKTITFYHDGIDTKEYVIYWKKVDGSPLTRENSLTPVVIPFIAAGDYNVIIPDQLPITEEATYIIGICARDHDGNESSDVETERFFDVTAPTVPSNIRIT